MANKVQTNDYGVNVLVESELTPNHKHIHWSDRKVENVKVVSEEEILRLWSTANKEEVLKAAKDWLKRQAGYAVSNCGGQDIALKHGDIVSFEESIAAIDEFLKTLKDKQIEEETKKFQQICNKLGFNNEEREQFAEKIVGEKCLYLTKGTRYVFCEIADLDYNIPPKKEKIKLNSEDLEQRIKEFFSNV